MKILQYSLFTIINIFAILSFVASQSVEQTTTSAIDASTSNALTSTKSKLLTNFNFGNKTDNDKKRKFKIRNQNKLFKLKKLLLESENKNSTSDKAIINTKKSSENATDTTSSLRNRTRNQLLILQKELRRLTKIAEKLSELNDIYTVTKQPPTKKKTDGEIKGKKNFNGKKGFSNKHKAHPLKAHNGDNEFGKKTNDQLSKNKRNDEGKQIKFKVNKKRIHTTIKPNSNMTTISPFEKGHVVTSHIYSKQFRKRTNKKHDINTSSTTFSPKSVNTSLPPAITNLPQ